MKKWIYLLITVVSMLIVSYAVVPQVLSNKVVDQGDIRGFRGMARETDLWNAAHPDDKTAWTNSMFGGMPTVMLTGNPDGDLTIGPFKFLQLGKRPATYFFICMVGTLLLMLAFGISLLPASFGAFAVTFCSYNMQIIQVGHNTKMLAMAFLPWVLAACAYTYRKALADLKDSDRKGGKLLQWLPQTFLGATLFAFSVSFQIKANHIQISYYLAIMLLLYALTLFIWIAAKKENRNKMGRFWVASLLLLVIGSAGIATNANQLIPSYKYSHETMRGGSELAVSEENQGKKKEGLDLDYATAWSYGWEELPNLMIPDFNGGSSSGELSMDSETVTLLRQAGQPNVAQVAKNLPLYWGPQPFTAGPMYMGAITIFLFILGLLLYRGKEKWWLLATTLIAILLGVGSHFMPFTEFWFKYAPFYNKFRTVSMALILLQYTLPLLGFLVLDRIMKKQYDPKDFNLKTWISLGITAGFCLLVYLIPSIAGDFSSSADSSLPEPLGRTLQMDRQHLLKQDALSSFLFIATAFLALRWGCRPEKNRKDGQKNDKMMIACLTIGCLIVLNMTLVGKRYLNDSHFTSAVRFDQAPQPKPVDKEILKDKDPDYRVLDLTSNIFNESRTSCFHKSIGGYSPVKMQRYQDLIDYHLVKEINEVVKIINTSGLEGFYASEPATPVLNMLNGKYYVAGEDVPPILNTWSYGNCWLVDQAIPARTPLEEITLLNKVNLRKQAIIGEDFSSFRNQIRSGNETDTLFLTSYAPNELKYHYDTSSERAAIFSEIYYPDGWTAKLEDGTELPLFRADWTLRGAILPAGKHEITMRFEPQSYKISSHISLATSITLYLLLILSGFGICMEKKKRHS